ncbi:filament-like plant protein 7 isoform X1 [Sesamum indicum]|uniref:Filament-like plant protein 7 isoform X1 n=1 Tax=Sesamum indicum TaxID=4182 RepID=A0A6I9TKD1_SESIN|nr:filament-like plant protein 7 isoform X1 [Sesamum indicum]XP_020551184.1 filament-like plant protein 7 isoform X1 [Sesamum indicum]
MDQKSWLWKKRSTEKTLVADKANNSLSRFEEEVTEVQKLQNEKIELERDLRILNEKLSSALSESNAKDNIAKKQVKIAEEAIAGDLPLNKMLRWEKAETEAISLKQEFDKVLQQKAASEERIGHLDAALKECMQQLRFVREEHEKRVHGAVVRASEEFEKIKIALDEKLAEAGKRLAKLEAENSQLMKALSGKDMVIEDLSKYRTQLEADFNALMLRVDSTEKEKASLKYEVRVLEKELDIRNEEREFNCRTADVARKRHEENVKRIAKLESECQRLRLLVRKRLPGPAALAKMKSEVEMLGNDQVGTRRRKSNHSPTSSMKFCVEVAPDAPSKRIDLLTEQLYTMEEQKNPLKDTLNKKSNELQFSSTTFAHLASRLSGTEGQVEELLKCQPTYESDKDLCFLKENSLVASSDVGSDDKASCAESWASALISELEHFKNKKQFGAPFHRNVGASDMNLMDDFAEMEKLAIGSANYSAGSSHHEEGNTINGTSGREPDGHSSSAPGMELASLNNCPLKPLISGQEIQSQYIDANRVSGWLGDMLKMLLDYSHASQRNPQEVLEDIKVALADNNVDTTADASCKENEHVISPSPIKSSNLDAFDEGNENDSSNTKRSIKKLRSDVSISVHKVLELLEGINIQSQDNGASESLSGKDDKLLSYKNAENPTGYMVRVFQWKTAELSTILQQLVQTCNDLLDGTTDLEQFVQQVGSNLEWIINHCFSLQDVSSMKDAIRNHLDWDELDGSRSESEVDGGFANHYAECNRLHIRREDMRYLPIVSTLSADNSACQMEELQTPRKEEANKESSTVDLEAILQPEIVKGECFRIQPQESKDKTENHLPQLEIMKQSEGKTENQIEKQKMMKEDLQAQVMETNHELRKACQKILHLEHELENRTNSCKKLEETCHDLKIQLKSMTSKEIPDNGKHWEKQLQNDWEITAASEKLAECQETILNLGKQLKALASPSDAALFDKVISTPADSVVTSLSTPRKNISQRSSLLDKMLAEDKARLVASPGTKNDTKNGNDSSAVSTNAAMESSSKFTDPSGTNHDEKCKTSAASMDIVPCKKKGGRSFFKRLFRRRKKGNSLKTSFS